MKIVVAMESELSLVPKCMHDRCIVTGVGALNVIRALDPLDRDEIIYNIGYAGSNSLPVGMRVLVGDVSLYHPNAEFESPTYFLGGDVPCFTSNDFVLSSDIEVPCVFDMELAYIPTLGFKHVVAEKVVSDNLDMKQFETFTG